MSCAYLPTLKPVNRYLHLLTTSYFLGFSFTYILDLLPPHSPFNQWMGILVFVTGFINMILIIIQQKPDKHDHKLWKYMLYLKAVLTVLVTPLTEKVLGII